MRYFTDRHSGDNSNWDGHLSMEKGIDGSSQEFFMGDCFSGADLHSGDVINGYRVKGYGSSGSFNYCLRWYG